jgi:ElaB/YqjD/DUF883 family membrane-anchored ribosome-binding protein
MEQISHTFPLPEPETHKLDAVVEQIEHQPAYQKFKDFVRANPWPCVLAACTIGFVLGAAARTVS